MNPQYHKPCSGCGKQIPVSDYYNRCYQCDLDDRNERKNNNLRKN